MNGPLEGLRVGKPQAFRNLAIFPLLGEDEQGPDYLLLDEALEKGLAEVTEVSQAGTVPNLAFVNKGGKPVLLVEGDELRGAKQNRILNLTILVAAGKTVEIPVSCVEQGRWSYNSSNFASGSLDAGGMAYAALRAANYGSVTHSLMNSNSAEGDQSKVWDNVGHKLRATKTSSSTRSMSDAYKKTEGDVKEYTDAFKFEAGQRGAVVTIDGKPVGLELFNTSVAFQKFMTKLVRSYALDAIETTDPVNPPPSEDVIADFLREAFYNMEKAQTFETVGEGKSYRWNDTMTGGARVIDGKALHIASFRK